MPATGPTRPLPISDPDQLREALRGEDERELQVLELRYGLADGHQHSLARIGRRLGLSAERVRQLEARAFERLEAREEGSAGAPAPFEVAGGPARHRFLRPWALMLLWLEPTHGAELRERLAELGMPGADYRFLRRLEAEGLLRSEWKPGDVGPDRRVYHLTDAGLEQLEQHAGALERVAQALANFAARRGAG